MGTPKSHSFPSRRIASVPSSIMFEIADRIREIQSKGKRVIDLSLGQPEVPAPSHIVEAIKTSLDHPITSYTSAAGSTELRTLISETLAKETGAKTDPSEVIVTSGSKHALFITLLSLVDPEEEILVPEPYFPPYAEIAALIGGTLTTVAINSENGLRLDLEALFSAV
ncbi:MAG TPA: aminotransferase class I/II-fold pyridoxal phosphate-dependent enzyme, partial [Nitrososphaerales archaeon]|nr:aminotransferase class I/II-fold pyridoxal phosphate-dependent enzyme [Nitrososphaerales archaeon]